MEDEKKSKVPKVALGGAIVGTAAGLAQNSESLANKLYTSSLEKLKESQFLDPKSSEYFNARNDLMKSYKFKISDDGSKELLNAGIGAAAGTLGSLAAYGAIKGIKKLAKRKTT